jgi:N-methylhydantoinase A/oxoprolinase/acetone carboxylase beta subunit
MSICLGIDVGGTFTDIAILEEETGTIRVHKVSSTYRDPADGEHICSISEKYNHSSTSVSLTMWYTCQLHKDIIDYDKTNCLK